uniref:SPIN-DOC-like zinc-finger domain-containing protein n=1 Tax=Dicentrarchus labrax TaxID=13489 RepID=A0A8P4G8E9_DICLA
CGTSFQLWFGRQTPSPHSRVGLRHSSLIKPVVKVNLSTKKMAKRKKDDEYRTFQDEWTEDFAFVERAGSAVCLICNDKIASMKRSNVKRHFDTRHATFASKYPAGDSRKKACQELLSRVQACQQQLRVWTRQGDYNSASFAGSLAIVRNGKPFTDGEYAKTFMLDVANELFDDFPNKDKIIKRIQDMPLSARTVHDRTITMANQVEETQVKDINAAPFFSLALDESTDVSHLSQFSVIARYAAGDTLREESLAILPIKGSTRGEDLFKSFMEFAHEKNLPMDKLLSVCTDGAPCMVGKYKGFVALLREHENRPILSFHCILHQEALCAQMCDGQLGEVMSLVIRVINFIVARALNDRQFKTLLDELSRGKVLSRFAACLNEIRTFLEMKGIEHPELVETEWLLKFYYLVDMTEHLNQLNVKMQGIGNTVLSLQHAVFAFENKLELFIMDLETGRLLHFEKLRQFKDACTASEPTQNFDLHQLAGFTSSLLQSFKARFGEFREHTRLFKFITHPNECSLNTADLNQLIIKTWNRVSIAVLTMFGSTYSCEQSFSHLKNIKSNLRSRLTDESLNACMKLNLTKYQPDYKAISKSMQHQKSH